MDILEMIISMIIGIAFTTYISILFLSVALDLLEDSRIGRAILFLIFRRVLETGDDKYEKGDLKDAVNQRLNI